MSCLYFCLCTLWTWNVHALFPPPGIPSCCPHLPYLTPSLTATTLAQPPSLAYISAIASWFTLAHLLPSLHNPFSVDSHDVLLKCRSGQVTPLLTTSERVPMSLTIKVKSLQCPTGPSPICLLPMPHSPSVIICYSLFLTPLQPPLFPDSGHFQCQSFLPVMPFHKTPLWHINSLTSSKPLLKC